MKNCLAVLHRNNTCQKLINVNCFPRKGISEVIVYFDVLDNNRRPIFRRIQLSNASGVNNSERMFCSEHAFLDSFANQLGKNWSSKLICPKRN